MCTSVLQFSKDMCIRFCVRSLRCTCADVLGAHMRVGQPKGVGMCGCSEGVR